MVKSLLLYLTALMGNNLSVHCGYSFLLKVPKVKLTIFGARVLSTAAASKWNSLPLSIHPGPKIL